MSTIRCVYTAAPNFPATDQHPSAVRYYRLQDDSIVTALPQGAVPIHVVDAIGGAPTVQEIVAFLTPTPPTADELAQRALAALNGDPDLSKVDLRKLLKAIVIDIACIRNGVAPADVTLAQINAERQRVANIYKAL